MELITLLERQVLEGELVDGSPESRAVFGKGILAVVSGQVAEALNGATASICSNSPMEEMLLDIKRSFGVQQNLEGITDIHEFFSRGSATYIALRELPDFLLLVVPLPIIKTIIVCGPEESPESLGIVM
jgi:hypothetical protein